jgi:hypothetical protein
MQQVRLEVRWREEHRKKRSRSREKSKIEREGGRRRSGKAHRPPRSPPRFGPRFRPVSALWLLQPVSNILKTRIHDRLTRAGPGMSHLSAETSALYLASKSNYQNILEGTHLPGVSYPETLAENLTSKRTSHKIAEQGRRNRINLALKEIEALLPPAILVANSKKEKSLKEENEDAETPTAKNSASGQGASKASTVEMAIIYIKSLQSELKETKEKLEACEKRCAESGNRESSAESKGASEG